MLEDRILYSQTNLNIIIRGVLVHLVLSTMDNRHLVNFIKVFVDTALNSSLDFTRRHEAFEATFSKDPPIMLSQDLCSGANTNSNLPNIVAQNAFVSFEV